jgi:hypothetical protein
VPDGRDVVVDFKGEGITHPIHIIGGRHHLVIGGEIDIKPVKGGEAGKKPLWDSMKVPSNHPYFTSERAIGDWASGTSCFEGMHVKLNGHAGDCIVGNSLEKYKNRSRQDRRIVLLNSRYEGWEGNVGHSNKGIHGDLFQNQSPQVSIHEFIAENLVLLGSFNFFTIHDWKGPHGLVLLKRVYADISPQYGRDQPKGPMATRGDDIAGPMLATRADKVLLEEVYYRPSNPKFTPIHVMWIKGRIQYKYCGKDYPNAYLIEGDFKTGPNPSPVVKLLEFAPANAVGKFYKPRN